MPDDSNAREMEAALHEDDEPEVFDALTPEQRRIINEEAIAEEEFIADQEDSVNPLFFKEADEEKEQKPANASSEQGLNGAFGSGDLVIDEPEAPISNEEELRKESVNEDEQNKTPMVDDFAIADPIEVPGEDAATLKTGDEELSVTNELNNLETEINNIEATPALSAEPVAELPVDPVTDASVNSAIAIENNVATAPVATTTENVATAPVATTTENIAVNSTSIEAASVTSEVTAPVATEATLATSEAVAPATPEATPAAAEATLATSEVTPVTEATTTTSSTTESAVGPTPIPAGMPVSSAPEEKMPQATDAAKAEKPKKGKAGLIIGLIVLLALLIGGCIFGVFFYNKHEAPEKQLSDAIVNAIDAPVLGTVSNAINVATGNTPTINLDIKSTELGNSVIKANVAIKDNSSFYVKANGLDTAGDAILEELLGGVGGDDDDETMVMKQIAASVFDGVVDAVNDKWIIINASDFSGSDRKEAKCYLEALNTILEKSSREKIAKIYLEHSFLKIKDGTEVEVRDGVNYYTVEIDERVRDEFMVDFKKTTGGEMLVKCVGDDDDDDDDDDYNYTYDVDCSSSLNSLDSDCVEGVVIEDDETTTGVIKLGITPWTHTIESIEVTTTTSSNSKKEDVVTTVNASFDFTNESEHKDAISVDDLAQNITKSIAENISSVLKDYSKKTCEELSASDLKDYGYASVKECSEDVYGQLKEYFDFDELDTEDLIKNMTGSLTSTVVDSSRDIEEKI